MTAVDIPVFTLNNGKKMPSVGIGCWFGQPGGGDAVEKMVKNALKLGYRHIDTANGYGEQLSFLPQANEEHVGKAVRESGIPREEIFITTKLGWSHHSNVREGLEASLKSLDVGYIDLYLMHWPQAANEKGEFLQPEESPTYVETWLEMEKLLDTGKVKSIGVSNFSISTLEILLPKVNIVPVTNQVELHPCRPQEDLKKYCEEKGILLTAYSPLGQPSEQNMVLLKDETIVEIAKSTKSSVGQVLLSWGVQRGTAVIPKSEKVERMKQNITLVKLSEKEMEMINNLHKKEGMHRCLLMAYTSEGKIFGWTFEQLGWNLREDGTIA